jgi:glutamate/tyrosine decarboxylase-like PLP-dependent enzyme
MIERSCDLTREFVEQLGKLPEVEVLTQPIINQGLVRFRAVDGDHDARTDEIIERINATGEAWFGPTQWHGKRVMRISLTNFRTNRDDIDRAVEAIKSALQD